MTVWLGLYCLGMAGSVVIVVSAYMVEYKRGLALTWAYSNCVRARDKWYGYEARGTGMHMLIKGDRS